MSFSSRIVGGLATVRAPVAWAFSVKPLQTRRNLSSRPAAQVSAEPIFSNKQLKKWKTLAGMSSPASALIQTRTATRMTRRAKQQTAVKEEDRTQTQNAEVSPYESRENRTDSSYQERSTTGQYEQQQQNTAQERYEAPSDVSLESLITPDVSAHLVKVYNTLAVTVGLAAVGGASAVFLVPAATLGSVALFAGIMGFLGVLGISFTNRDKVGLRQGLLYGTGLLMGASIAPLLSVVSPGTIVMAFTGTAAIFAGFSVAALRAKSDTFIKLGGPLIGGLFLLIGLGLFSWLAPMLGFPLSPAVAKALYNINLWGGLALFSVFISYDTANMIHDARMGETDHVSHSLSMFLNVLNIFVRLLAIFRSSD